MDPSDISTTVVDAFGEFLNVVAASVPQITVALIIFIIGVLVAPLFGAAARRLVQLVRIDEGAEKVGVADMLRTAGFTFKFSSLIGKLVKWFILIAFLIAAVNTLGWEEVSLFLNDILFYIPNVIVAVIILAVGLIAGSFLQQVMAKLLKASTLPVKHHETLGRVAKWAVVVFAVLAALLQLGIAESLIEILFAGVVFALALAFGLGGREKAAKVLDSLDGSMR